MTFKKTCCIAAAAVLLITTGIALGLPATRSSAARIAGEKRLTLPETNVTRTQLPNGLVVVAGEVPGGLASVQLWVRTGSVTEDKYMGSGISHFVEHMLFKGTEKLKAGEAAFKIRSLGGEMNAYTTTDRTVYHITIPEEHTEKALALLADAAANSSFDPVEMEKERDVILREMDMNEDDPERKLSRLLWSTAFQVHPYRHPVIGYRTLLEKLTREDLVAYHAERYTPDNMVVVVAGDISSDRVVSLAVKYFGGMERGRRPPPGVPEEPSQPGPRELFVEWDVNVTRLLVGYHIPNLTHPDLYPLDVMAIILGHGQSSRLFKEVKLEAGLVHSVSAWSYTPRYPGLFGIDAVLDDENLDSALAAIRKEVERLRTEPVSKSELEKAKRMVLTDYIRGLETVAGRAREFGVGEVVAGDVNFASVYVKNIQRVEPEDIMRAANKYLSRKNMTSVVLKPFAHTEKPKRADRKTHIIRKFTLSNGATVITAPRHALPLVSVRCVWKGGTLVETEKDAGISRLLASMITLGAPELVKQVEERGGSVEAYSGHNTFGCSLNVLRDDLDHGLSVLSQIIRTPSLPEDVMEGAKAAQIAAIRSQQDEVFSAAMVEFRKAFFGSHPYRFITAGTEEAVENISRDDLLRYHAAYCTPAGMVAAVYGDVAQDEAAALMEKHFGGIWNKAGQISIGNLSREGHRNSSRKQLNRNQAVIICGYPGAAVTGTDRHALQLTASILSGHGSRLWEEIREKKGLAYSVGAFNIFGIDPGSFIIYASVEPDKTEEVKKYLLAEIERLRTESVRDEELTAAKAELIGDNLRERESISGAAFSAALNELYGLGYDAAERFPEMISKVTSDDILRVAKEKFKPDERTIVIVSPDE